jgi:hypothetical protein
MYGDLFAVSAQLLACYFSVVTLTFYSVPPADILRQLANTERFNRRRLQ